MLAVLTQQKYEKQVYVILECSPRIFGILRVSMKKLFDGSTTSLCGGYLEKRVSYLIGEEVICDGREAEEKFWVQNDFRSKNILAQTIVGSEEKMSLKIFWVQINSW